MAIEKIKKSSLNLQTTTVYNFNELTLTELLNKYFNTINNCVDVSNESLNFLEWLKNEGLPTETNKEIEKMYSDGRLTTIINDFSGNVLGLINNLELKDSELENKTNENSIEIEILQTENANIKNQYLPNMDIEGGTWND